MRLFRTIASALIGSTLSIALLACSPGPDPSTTITAAPPPEVIRQVLVAKAPPPELLACPVAPAGFPAGAAAVMPIDVREATKRLAVAYADATAQLRRLIAWADPGVACEAPAPIEAPK